MTTEQLLKLSNAELLEAAKEAYWGLKGKLPAEHDWVSPDCHQCVKCGWLRGFRSPHTPCPIPYRRIPGCIEKVAFDMRDACVAKHIDHKWSVAVAEEFGIAACALIDATAKHWIIAAVKAFEAKP